MRRIDDPEAAGIETEEGATRWVRVVLGRLIPACDPDDASPVIWAMQSARREVLKLQRRLEREGLPPTKVAAGIRALLLAEGLERIVEWADGQD